VQDDVGAELERPLEIGRGEGVVDDDHRADLVRGLRRSLDVDHVQQRVRRRLEPDKPRLLVEVLREPLVDLFRREEGDVVALRLVDLRQEPVDAAVDVVDRDDALARVNEMHDRRHGRHAGGEGDAVLSALERGETDLQRRPRRVRDARVLVALVLPDRLLGERRRLVDRDRDRAGRRIRLLTLVDRAGLEVHIADSSDGGCRARARARAACT
jgi:hypothetical protein